MEDFLIVPVDFPAIILHFFRDATWLTAARLAHILGRPDVNWRYAPHTCKRRRWHRGAAADFEIHLPRAKRALPKPLFGKALNSYGRLLRAYPNNRREASRCHPPTHLWVPFGDRHAPATGLFGQALRLRVWLYRFQSGDRQWQQAHQVTSHHTGVAEGIASELTGQAVQIRPD